MNSRNSELREFIQATTIHQIKYKVMALLGHSESLWPSNAITLYLIWWMIKWCVSEWQAYDMVPNAIDITLYGQESISRYDTDQELTKSWWRHNMETLCILLKICQGNIPVTGGFRSKQASSFNAFFVRQRKHSSCRGSRCHGAHVTSL